MKAVRLRTEYLENPIGIGITRPRLFWNAEGGKRQSAYRLKCFKADGSLLWDSGKQPSPSLHADWAGPALESRSFVSWQVQLWDEEDRAGDWSEPASFELGLLSGEDWKAQWITGDYRVSPKRRYPVDCFRKRFSCGEAARARLYITACGLYEACIDGKKAGTMVLAPGITDYRKRIQYQTVDVTPLLGSGTHELTVQLSDGWYRGSTGAWGLRNEYGTETALLCQLEIEETSGKKTLVLSDETWAWSCDGPVRFADNKDGETVDARLTPGYGGKAKKTARSVVPSASDSVLLTEHESFQPEVLHTPSGKTVLDFGQNIAGYIAFSLDGCKEGETLRLAFGEMLDRNGEFTQRNIQCVNKKITTPLQQVLYTCRDGRNDYRTRFSIFGFRFVSVESETPLAEKTLRENFRAIAVYSAMEQTIAFDSSNDLLNRFVSCTLWSTKNNSADLPTDCPTRERHGWTGDAQIFFGTAAFLFDYAAFSRKYLRDIYDWQRRDGRLPQIAPMGGVDRYMYPMNGSPGWSDAGILIPYRFWKAYGDRRILEEFYPGMKKYTDFMLRRCGKRGLLAKPLKLSGEAARFAVNTGQSYGEWAEPEAVHKGHWTDQVFPHPEVSTAYTAWMAALMAEIAGELGKEEDKACFLRYADGCKLACQALMRLPAFTLDTDRQASLVRPLMLGLLDEEQASFARSRLLQAVERCGYRVGTGFLSTPFLLFVLSGIDLETAYRVLENEEMPGWLFMPKSGSTTVWESWEGTSAPSGIASLDHYSKGAVLEWVFSVMCGIRIDGENHFTIAPRPGGHFAHAGAAFQSIYGKVESRWERRDGEILFTIRVPAGTEALVRLPDGGTFVQEAGEKTYRVQAG